MIDWQTDLEKKVANLLRNFKAEAEAHGAELLVQVTVEVIDKKADSSMQKMHSARTPKKKPAVSDESPIE